MRVLVAIVLLLSTAFADFDVREHLSSSTRYEVSRDLGSKLFTEDPSPPEGCVPIHLNLVARHGTRAPTKKRLKQLEELEVRLSELAKSMKSGEFFLPSGWEAAWRGKFVGGELTIPGEEEMFRLGQRIRERFPEIFSGDYHPKISPILTTQVHRSAQSAVAFGMGLFSNKGSLGDGKHRAFSVISDNKTNDIHLRFHDCCQNYKESKAVRRPAVAKLQKKVYAQVSAAATKRYKLPFTNDDISSLWFLCKQEASVLEITTQACKLFLPEEVRLLEWADDVELHHLKGYGDSINYKMGISLLSNVKEAIVSAMEESARDSTDAKFLEKAKLRFAHAETVLPFACLLGLFLDGADVKVVQEEKSVAIPPKPPLPRLWRGSLVAPFGGNTMLVLYKCSNQSPAFRVQAFHNEHPMIMPACNGSHFCPVDLFLDKIVSPHLKHSFEVVCFQPKKVSWFSSLLRLFGLRRKPSPDDDHEL
ncbi:hypothetical protein SELMODRAFT_182070 [Selaginella moellendorffii]|uniref:Multiple inositol polyphosphate phosphatase 1 n=1 Tax=Selaginella moellendorffii TaxID=88036 RepID=D8SRG2_SELML|nr:multiple inositol polyphosphate phosphatase 1 [Selaginella moellendorffii]EFJ13138.1 hypothetical protein SELMODRAFT_182070 [Selaginella moellendorffii]|eukprot:XP_002985961.1 multiple inositol polyphosphate phosphatase 1 [Selaginella moellendorffii]